MITPLLLAALLAVLAPRPATPSATQPPPPVDAAELAERVEAVLGRIHGRADPAAWQALGPDGAAALARLAVDPAGAPGRRARAVAGLSILGGPRAEAALRALAAAEGEHWSVRTEALRGAGRLLPAASLAPLLVPVLRGASRPVDRAVAAEVLAERAPAAGCGAVRDRAALEAAPDRPGFRRALARCAALGR
jgi:hypothetical protein